MRGRGLDVVVADQGRELDQRVLRLRVSDELVPEGVGRHLVGADLELRGVLANLPKHALQVIHPVVRDIFAHPCGADPGKALDGGPAVRVHDRDIERADDRVRPVVGRFRGEDAQVDALPAVFAAGLPDDLRCRPLDGASPLTIVASMKSGRCCGGPPRLYIGRAFSRSAR